MAFARTGSAIPAPRVTAARRAKKAASTAPPHVRMDTTGRAVSSSAQEAESAASAAIAAKGKKEVESACACTAHGVLRATRSALVDSPTHAAAMVSAPQTTERANAVLDGRNRTVAHRATGDPPILVMDAVTATSIVVHVHVRRALLGQHVKRCALVVRLTSAADMVHAEK